MSRKLAIISAIVAVALGSAVAVPLALATGTYNLNGKWKLLVITCKHKKYPAPGNTVVSQWSAKTGNFSWKLTVGKASINGTATESGSTITVTSSNYPKLDGHSGTVSQNGNTLKATFPAPCNDGTTGYGVFTKKAKPPHKKHHKPKHHKPKPHKGKHHKHHKK